VAWGTGSMRLSALTRTTTFRLSMLYGLLFAVGSVALLGMVYWKSAVYLTKRVDGILNTELTALAQSPRPGLRQRLVEELTLNGDQTNIFALFSADGTRIAGNLAMLPQSVRLNGSPLEVPPTPDFPTHARLIARRLPSGEVLVVGRDVHQLREMRSILSSALIWSGALIILIGLLLGTALSVGPLRRLRDLQLASRAIANGDMKRRMPVSQRQDELDMFATTVNTMMDEVERLMSEVKAATDTIAHDLLTPLARASMHLRRIEQMQLMDAKEVGQVNTEISAVLDRFRAILRVAELEAGSRRAGFAPVDLADVVAPVAELYGPLAEESGVRLLACIGRGAAVEADRELLFEAVSNLVDNAIKFAGHGGAVQLRLNEDPKSPQIIVQDNGPGIAASERTAVLQRFYRAAGNQFVPGSGLGLSVVAAIVRLHGFELTLEDAAPGLRAVIRCYTAALAH
jgi:signal transduction histidine kinase